jgi:hypothetical protein
MAHSPEYLNELKILHNINSFGRASSIPNIVDTIINKYNINSILDFGCGKGLTSNTIKNTYPNINLFSYDPVTSPIILPDAVDLIYSSDVLEHVEPELLDETLHDLCNRATRYQYHLIACHPAKKSLSDGRNAHLIIENPKWWKHKIKSLKNWNITHEEIIQRDVTVKKGPPIHVTKYIVVLEKA